MIVCAANLDTLATGPMNTLDWMIDFKGVSGHRWLVIGPAVLFEVHC